MPWFAFDIDAYDADTMHLSAAEDGVYSRLLRHYYRTRLPLPDDDRALAQIARVSIEEWEAMKATVRAFFRARRGRLHNKKADSVLDREDALAKKRSDRSQNAARKRHGKSKASLLRARPGQNVVVLKRATRPDKNQIPPPTPPQGGADTPDFVAFWEEYPHKVGRPAASRAWERALAKADVETIMAGMRRYVRQKPDDREWCNPATFLREERWLDQPSAKAVNGPSGALPAEPWVQRIAAWRKSGRWPAEMWGPAPGEPDCRVPAAFLDLGRAS